MEMYYFLSVTMLFGAKIVISTELIYHASPALGQMLPANLLAVLNKQVVYRIPLSFRNQSIELGLDFIVVVLLIRNSNPFRNHLHMRVYGYDLLAVGKAQHSICCLGSDARKRHELFASSRNSASILFHNNIGNLLKPLSLGLVEVYGPDYPGNLPFCHF